MPVELFWASAFLDLPAATHDRTLAFWRDATGYAVSARRGDREEFCSLVPPGADAHLKVQRIGTATPRVHLDLHVPRPHRAARTATGLGARIVADHGDYVELASPGGMPFCLVDHPAGRLALPARWPDGSSSLVDQVCLDIPAAGYEFEAAFWTELTGWRHTLGRFAEFADLSPPSTVRVRLLLQRLDEAAGPTCAHLDVSADDRPAEVLRHRGWGAEVIDDFEHWTVLRDPSGAAYCITDRDPTSGVLPPRSPS